jgi:hypothetical protein
MNDNDLSFDIKLPNKFKIEVTQNYEGANWYLCVYDSNGEHFGSHDCDNQTEVFDIIKQTSKEVTQNYEEV